MSKLKVVVFTGAGVSREAPSNIPTFRDADGLWANHKIEDVCTPKALKENLQGVLDFYNARRRDILKAEPNDAHKGLAELEKDYDVQIITQNIDDLHERGGSTKVLHLHGEIMKCRGVKESKMSIDPKLYDYNTDLKVGDICGDGHQMRPHVVFFKEPVPMLNSAISLVATADVLVVIGTSLQVYPASSLLDYSKPGIPIFYINPEPYEHVDDALAPDLRPRIVGIVKPATEGVERLKEALKTL